jgi:PAS domain S-box-containing protein
MEVQLEHPTDEIKRLQRCINDLVSLLALPAMWSGSAPCDIVQTLLDSLLRMLDLDFVYVSLTNPVAAAPSETVRIAQSQEQMFRPRELCTFLNRWLGDDPQKRYLQERSHFGDEEVSLVSWPLGVQREIGVIVAGSRRADFPQDTETLYLGIAANQALIGLQQARLLTEQKRVADELDHSVVQRTAELAAANEVLRKEVAERRRAEEALAASEHNLRLIVDSIPGFVSLLTPTGEVELVNPQLVEYCGRTLEELRLWGTSDTIHAEDLPRVVQLFARSITSGNPYDFEARLRRFDGVYRWFQVRALPVRDANGRILRWCSLLTDIDDRKRAEAQLAGEKQLLEMIASGRSLPDVLKALCRFVEETADADCRCGVYPIDWRGPTFTGAVAPSLPVSYTDPIEGLRVSCDTAPCGLAAYEKRQVIVEDIQSDPRWAASSYQKHVLAHGLRSVWSTPICSLQGSVLGTFCVYQGEPASPTQRQLDLIAQVTHIASIAIERAQGEAALKRSEVFLAEGQRLSLTGTFSWGVATDEIKWSDQLYRIFEFEPHLTVTLELIRTRVHPEDMMLLNEMIERARSASSDFQYEHRLLMPDYSVKYLQLIAHGTRDNDGRLEYIGAVQDVTQRQISEEALAKARSELADVARVTSLATLTASIAHEVNQPLSGIVTNASTCLRMLTLDPPNVHGARETARRTIRDGNRASDVITRLRALYGKKDTIAERVDLNHATREVIALSLSELKRNRVILRCELAADLPLVRGDRVQLQQVILNLLRNGSDAMNTVHDRPRGLLIRTERDEGGRALLSVKDAGIGFDPQSMDKLFQPFYTTKNDGMGIGLSVSRSIIEQHGGCLWATLNDGPGATFSFSIPGATNT